MIRAASFVRAASPLYPFESGGSPGEREGGRGGKEEAEKRVRETGMMVPPLRDWKVRGARGGKLSRTGAAFSFQFSFSSSFTD